MNRRLDTRLLFASLCFAILSCGAAAPAMHSSARSASDRVVVFKDGYALIVKTWSAMTDKNGEIHVDDVPDAAVLGSFWATSKQGQLLGMHAGFESVEERFKTRVTAADHYQVLAANPGKRAEVRFEDTTYTGKIGAVLGRTTMVPDRDEPAVRHETTVGHNFVLETPDGAVVLPTAGIRALIIRDMALEFTHQSERTERTKRLTLRFAKAGARRDVTITYFRPGIRWIPTYRLDLADKKKAHLSLQAELINEAEDLIDIPIDVVVGVPNFRFKDTVSPLVLESAMKRALATAAPQLMGQMHNNFSNASYASRSTEHRAAVASSTPKELVGSATSDLFVFSLPRMTLKKGERAAIPIFDRRVPYRHVYTWELHLKKTDFANTPSAAGIVSPLNIAKNEVWHQIELENDTDTVWTTGAIMIMDGQRPLAQELLTYTSRSDLVRVPVTISVETRGTATAEEVGRKLDALEWDRTKYARIDKRAKLELCNHKATPVDVEITLRLGGRVSKASDGGTVTLGAHRPDDWTSYRGSAAVNNSSTVVWKTRLGPGALFEPTALYRYFTRH